MNLKAVKLLLKQLDDNNDNLCLMFREIDNVYREEMYLNMQYYMEYCQSKGYVTPQEWIEKYKHF